MPWWPATAAVASEPQVETPEWGVGRGGPGGMPGGSGGEGTCKWIGLGQASLTVGSPLCLRSLGEPQPPTVRWWESLCAGSLAESMTESETDLRPALRRDEIMPVGSFWLLRTFLGYHPPVPSTHGEHHRCHCHLPAGRENHDLSLQTSLANPKADPRCLTCPGCRWAALQALRPPARSILANR